MTKLKKMAVEMIQRMPEEKMFNVMNILQNLEGLAVDKNTDKEQAIAAFEDIMKYRERLSVDFDADRELEGRGGKVWSYWLIQIFLWMLLPTVNLMLNMEKRYWKCVQKRQVTGIMAAHSIPNLFYILRKDFIQEERRALLKNLCKILRISDLNMKKILAALDND